MEFPSSSASRLPSRNADPFPVSQRSVFQRGNHDRSFFSLDGPSEKENELPVSKPRPSVPLEVHSREEGRRDGADRLIGTKRFWEKRESLGPSFPSDARHLGPV